MQTATTITLSMASRLTRLMPVPGQDPHRAYGVVSEGLPQPSNGLGYVVEIVDFRTVRPLAWIRTGMSLWACDTPLAAEPHRSADLTFLRDSSESRSGVVRTLRTGTMDVARWHSGEKEVRYSLELGEGLIGSYAKERPTLTVRTLAALCWVVLVEQHPASMDALGLADALTVFSSESLPDALDIIHRKAKRSTALALLDASLEAAGSGAVRTICTVHPVEGIFLQSTHLFWLRFDPEELSDEEQQILCSVEAAVNRAVLLITWVLAQNLGPRELDRELWTAGERWSLTGILDQVPAFFDAHNEGNPRRTIYGATCERGGEWDVRSRIAQAVEQLRLPTRLPFRFDCHVERGVVAMEAALAPASALPAFGPTATRLGLRRSYAIRLALLLAALGFGASVGITRVRVTLFDGSLDGNPYLGLDERRGDFAATLLPALRRQEEPLSLMDLGALEPEGESQLCWGQAVDELEPLGLASRHDALRQRNVALPQALATLLRANTAGELDVYGTSKDPLLSEMAHILDENSDSALLSVMELEGLLSRIDKPEEGSREPLYCSNGTDRLIISLAEGDPSTRYTMVRDVIYAAKMQLARLYLSLGDIIRALEAAEECVHLAPTSPASHITQADIYARIERYGEAADCLIRALGLVLTPSEANYVFYRLAFSLWKTGRTQAAEAAYVLAVHDEAVGAQARMELAELREQNGFSGDFSAPAARMLLETQGIPIPLADELLRTLGAACVGLTDVGVFDPTWQGLRTLLPTLGGDDLTHLILSLKEGVPRTP